jgi:hypothetical protein
VGVLLLILPPRLPSASVWAPHSSRALLDPHGPRVSIWRCKQPGAFVCGRAPALPRRVASEYWQAADRCVGGLDSGWLNAHPCVAPEELNRLHISLVPFSSHGISLMRMCDC